MERNPELNALVLKCAHQCQNCAQAGFLSMQERFKLECDVPNYLRALTAYPGIARTGETCGAVSGPLLALGLALGPIDKTDMERTGNCLAAASQFCSEVEKEFGSTRCGDIIESCCGVRYDLSNPEDSRKYMDAGGLMKCMNVVQTTVHIATRILENAVITGAKA